MTKQRTEEWTKSYNDDYFNRQFKTPYRSTVKFCEWLEKIKIIDSESNQKILDIGTGKGSNLYYMKKLYPNCEYLGLDINNDFVEEGNLFFKNEKIDSCKLEFGDIYKLDREKLANKYDGIISYQTLSWLPGYEKPLEELTKLNSNWLAFSSLFYDGLVDCKIELSEFENESTDTPSNKTFYNIYSLPKIKHFFAERGYTKFQFIPFEIDIELAKPEHSHMQTYTEELKNGTKIQRSGPLLMSWYFIIAQK